MKFRELVLVGVFSFFCGGIGFSASYSPQQLIPVDSWIYDALYTLNAETKSASIADIGPCSVQELQLYFSLIDYDSLSEAGKKLYYDVQDFFAQKNFTLDFGPFSLGFNVNVHPELLYKSNKDIDWTFGSQHDLTWDKIYYNEDGTINHTETISASYGDVSAWGGHKLTTPLLSLPFYLKFGDIAFIETVPFVTSNFLYMSKPDNFTNIPLAFEAMDFMQPTTAYFSIGYLFKNNLGIDFQIGKEGLQIGRSLLGSVLYNNTFQTDAYFKFDFYSPKFKYDLNVAEIDHTKYLYLHNIEFVPFKWLKIGLTEGTLINDSFELRYLNPLMIMHSYHSWTEYRTEAESSAYNECHVSAYFGFTFDLVPIKNLRIYGIYSQVEMQLPSELESEYGKRLPNSLAFQLGAEYKFPSPHFGGWWSIQLEGIYSSPFMYYKTGADWSLYRARYDNYLCWTNPLCSWIGSPFGPDCAGFEIKGGYKQGQKWSADLSYQFMAHGENSFNLFSQVVDCNGKTYWVYYPSTFINGAYVKDSEVARNMGLSGTVEYKNQLTLDGNFVLNRNWSFDGQIGYAFVFNNNNVLNNFQQGIQLAFSVNYKVF